MQTNINVRVDFAEMLRVLPDELLRAEMDKRASEPARCVAPAKKDHAAVSAYATDSELLGALDDDAIGEAAWNRGIYEVPASMAIEDAVKDIDRAVKAGDMMHYCIL
jgi:hypothetical protein